MYNPARPREIESWTLSDLRALQVRESDLYEFKSSAVPMDELPAKLARAASGFWNSGGGLLVVGVDQQGNPDGGLSRIVGHQDLRDWVDQVLGTVTPAGPYAVALIEGGGAEVSLEEGNVVLLVAFGSSHNGPHMAMDKRYYIRAGAHTVPASHFLVEAIRSSRGLQQPWLECLLRYVPVSGGVAVQMAVVAVNDSPALGVQVSAEPIEGRPAGYSPNAFPKRVPLIDRLHPFVLNLNSVEALRDSAFMVHLAYSDLRGRYHSASCVVDTREQLGPVMC